jgi:hypothetical protein
VPAVRKADLTPSRAAKAYVALAVSIVIAALTAWQAAQGDGMTGADWATVVLAGLAPVAVWAKGNADPAPKGPVRP